MGATVAKVQQRAPVQAPAFARLLARLADADIPPSGPGLGERLGQWIDWNRAVVLARALDGRLPKAGVTGDAAGDVAADAAECARVRASLAEAIAGERGLNLPTPAAAPDYAPFRQYCLAMQRAMQTASGRLRGQLRERLTAGSPQMARLAEVDAVMEQALSPREHGLLSGVPLMLEAYFGRLCAAAAQPQAEAAESQAAATVAPSVAAPGAWLALFRRDLKDVLLAELDVRFHPIEGLLAALRTS
ncbi:DUF3348 domain-containing protein [Pseudoxanthomonas jiangsuensis]|uniref:DUF3348 domain-containing protein n=1 Tax=Pseudoxanthomonas jiangsuensis TaxID=619688 RepID=UPI001B885D34|nr:DUF3348 domain-containing protein [Pseudoxanthomonas jiangsuensis]